MARAKEFVRILNNRKKNFQKNSVEVANQYALAIQKELLQNTPVDTAKAISNWTVTLDRPHDAEEPTYFVGMKGSSREASIRSAYDQAKTALSDRRYGQRIFITNTAPYILRLNDGYSMQAPAGFIEDSVYAAIYKVHYKHMTFFEKFVRRSLYGF